MGRKAGWPEVIRVLYNHMHHIDMVKIAIERQSRKSPGVMIKFHLTVSECIAHGPDPVKPKTMGQVSFIH